MKLCVLVALNNQLLIDTLYWLYHEYRSDMQIFLYHDGVFLLNNSSFIELAKHVKVTLCSVSAEERNIKQLEDISWGSLYDLSNMISKSDKLISFTRES